MPQESSRNYKRIDVYQDLVEAAKALAPLGDPLVSVGEALTALGQALKRLKYASERAKPTVHEWTDEKGRHVKVSRDGLPRSIRTRAAKLVMMMDALATEVKGVPITPEQKALAKVTRAKARAAKGGRR